MKVKINIVVVKKGKGMVKNMAQQRVVKKKLKELE